MSRRRSNVIKKRDANNRDRRRLYAHALAHPAPLHMVQALYESLGVPVEEARNMDGGPLYESYVDFCAARDIVTVLPPELWASLS